MYPSEWPTVIASDHGWLIALIAAEAGLCPFYACVSTRYFLTKKPVGDGRRKEKRKVAENDNCTSCFLSPHRGDQGNRCDRCRIETHRKAAEMAAAFEEVYVFNLGEDSTQRDGIAWSACEGTGSQKTKVIDDCQAETTKAQSSVTILNRPTLPENTIMAVHSSPSAKIKVHIHSD